MVIFENRFSLVFLCLLQPIIVDISFANDHDATFKLEAFSVSLPTNSEWQQKANPHQITLGRSLDGNPFHTFVLEAREYPVTPEPINAITTLLGHISRLYEKEAVTVGRHKLTKHSETITNRLGFDCVEYHKAWIDNGGVSTKFKTLTVVAQGLICIHPDSANHLIEISYSSRNVSGVIPQAAINEGETFLNSLRALPIAGKI